MPLINANADVSSGALGVIYALSFHLYPYIFCGAAMAMVSLCICTDSFKPLLLDDAISTKKIMFCLILPPPLCAIGCDCAIVLDIYTTVYFIFSENAFRRTEGRQARSCRTGYKNKECETFKSYIKSYWIAKISEHKQQKINQSP